MLARVRRLHWFDRRSLRVQLTLRVWLAMIVLFAINNTLQLVATRKDISTRVLHEQRSDLDYLAYGVHRWAFQLYQSFLITRNNPLVQNLQPKGTQAYFDVLQRAYPARELALYDREGRLVAATGSHPKQTQAMRQELLNRSDFLRARSGEFIYEIGRSVLTGQTCFLMRAPVYSPGHEVVPPLDPWQGGLQQQAKVFGTPAAMFLEPAPVEALIKPFKHDQQTPIGVITFCLPLDRLGQDSGLTLLHQYINSEIEWSNKRGFGQIRIESLPKAGSVLLLLTNDGHLLFPHLFGTSSWILTPERLRGTHWGSVVAQALKSGSQSSFTNLKVKGRDYLLTTRAVDPVWSIALLVEKEFAYRRPDSLLWVLIGNELIVLLLAALVINVTCSQATVPIRQAGLAIRQLASGKFDVNLPLERTDEIGHLYRDIVETADHLRQFLIEQTAYAVTRKQIETARLIQQSFLVNRLPESPHLSLAFSFNPALEVAGDWYDVMEANDVIYVVIADVCDKGVGAALFMSVFRTLLRYEILRASAELQSSDNELTNIMSQVNAYMAETHRESTMFATVFVAAIDPGLQQLRYVCAGHESPFLLSQDAEHSLTRLHPTGPAVGIFPEAVFTVETQSFRSGDLLFAFTDGLTDARSPDGVSWGVSNLETLLVDLLRRPGSAQHVVDQIMQCVNQHMAGAEPFDDLTMLAVKVV